MNIVAHNASAASAVPLFSFSVGFSFFLPDASR